MRLNLGLLVKKNLDCILKLALFEVCVDSVESALAAQSAGAHRIELCEALIIGGVTPSLGKIQTVLKALSENTNLPINDSFHHKQPIIVHVLIRPRGGDFCYTRSEIDMMLLDIKLIKSIGRSNTNLNANNSLSVSGVVIGALQSNGTIDETITTQLIKAAKPEMTVTFHRAIDVTRDTLEAFRVCRKLGINRVLSSGRASTALLGVEMLKEMVQESKKEEGEGGSIIVLAGGGINGSNAAEIIEKSGVTELHGSARVQLDGKMTYRPPIDEIIYMGSEQRLMPSIEFGIKQSTIESITEILNKIR